MSSRKSSRKSSRASGHKSSKRDSKSPTDTIEHKDYNYNYSYIGLIFSLVLQGLVIYYLINLEGVDCNCIRDWRHNYIKYFAIFAICWSVLLIIIPSLSKKYNELNTILMILTLMNIYAFFTYIGELNATKCVCAVDKQPTLNIFMNFLRWFQLISLIIMVLFIVLFLLFIGSILNKVLAK